jgi:ABC-2 type transport system permease protein
MEDVTDVRFHLLYLRQFLQEWLKAIGAVNPLTYLTELGRDAMTYGTLIYLTAFSAALTLVERLLTAN